MIKEMSIRGSKDFGGKTTVNRGSNSRLAHNSVVNPMYTDAEAAYQ